MAIDYITSARCHSLVIPMNIATWIVSVNTKDHGLSVPFLFDPNMTEKRIDLTAHVEIGDKMSARRRTGLFDAEGSIVVFTGSTSLIVRSTSVINASRIIVASAGRTSLICVKNRSTVTPAGRTTIEFSGSNGVLCVSRSTATHTESVSAAVSAGSKLQVYSEPVPHSHPLALLCCL